MYQIVDAYFRLSTIFAKGFFYFHGYLYELIRLGLSYCHGDKKILTKKNHILIIHIMEVVNIQCVLIINM